MTRRPIHQTHDDGTALVSMLMTPRPVAVAEELSAEAARGLMLQRGIGALPVVDRAGRPVGILSKTDLLRGLPEPALHGIEARRPVLAGVTVLQLDGGRIDDGDEAECEGLPVLDSPLRTVHDVMTPFVIALPSSARVSEAAALMSAERIQRVPIVDDQGKLVGMLSTFDLVRLLCQGDLPRAASGREGETDA